MPVSEVLTGFAGLKAVMDTLKTFKDISDANVRNKVAVELQEKILAAYQSQFALAEKVGALETEVAALKSWDAEKAKYELQNVTRTFLAYVLKSPERNVAQPHALCTNCYERGFKATLHSNGKSTFHDHAYFCPSCKTAYACPSSELDRLIMEIDLKPVAERY